MQELIKCMNKRIILFFQLIILAAFAARSQDATRFFPEKDLVTTGIYYYPEHWSESQWERDIANISRMGYEFVHLAEFAWFKMEPQEGKFDFAWLDRVVGLCAKYKLKVLLCTPSATTPAWMREKYPETFVMDGHYIRGEHGTRGLGSIVNSKYRWFAGRIITEMGSRYGHNPNVIGWQLDNEPDAKPDYSPSSQQAFRDWLKNKYKTIHALNAAWGTAFWSQWYDRFGQVIIPNTTLVGWWGNNPHALLDFKRYSADAQAAFLDSQAVVLRKYISPDQFITTNYTAVATGSDPRRTKKLDFAAYTAYPNGGADNRGKLGFRLGDERTILFAAEYFKATGGFSGVMEMQPGPVNWGGFNPLLLPGTVRMWLYHTFGAGGKIACSYRYRQILYSAEQYHAGVIRTDGITPSRGGEEYMQFMKEIRELRKLYQPGTRMPEKLAARKTAILWNLENFWSIDRQKQTYQWDAWNYPVRFLELAKSFGAPVDIVGPGTDLSEYKVVIIPAYEMADTALVRKWKAYVAGGGHLIITCRTATKDVQGHFREGEWASALSGLIGAHITATDMMPGNSPGDIRMDSAHYYWNSWADLLTPDSGTDVLAIYNDQFYKGAAAVVRRAIGKGTVTYIGAATTEFKLEKGLLRNAYHEAGADTEDYPPGVYVYWRDGFYIAVNYSSEEYALKVPVTGKVLVGESVLQPGGVAVWSE